MVKVGGVLRDEELPGEDSKRIAHYEMFKTKCRAATTINSSWSAASDTADARTTYHRSDAFVAGRYETKTN